MVLVLVGGECNCTWKCTLFLVLGKVPVPEWWGGDGIVYSTVCCRPGAGN